MSRTLKIIFWVSILSLMLSTGVFGFFSGRVDLPAANLTAGTLYLGAGDSLRGQLEGCVQLAGMIPGECPRDYQFTVKNLGNLTAYINGLSASIKASDDKFLANAIEVCCTGPGGEKLYNGSLLSLDGNTVPTGEKLKIDPGESKLLHFVFQFDPRAGNWYKDKNIAFSVAVYAGQDPDQQPDTNVVIAGNDLQKAVDTAAPGSIVLVPAGEYPGLTIGRPDVTIKARDVIFDTVIDGITLVNQLQGIKICGLTVNGKGSDCLSLPGSCRNVIITDNIFQGEKNGLENLLQEFRVDLANGLEVQRNDFTPLTSWSLFDCSDPNYKFKPVNIFTGKSQTVRYNLGLDLDPAKEAL